VVVVVVVVVIVGVVVGVVNVVVVVGMVGVTSSSDMRAMLYDMECWKYETRLKREIKNTC